LNRAIVGVALAGAVMWIALLALGGPRVVRFGGVGVGLFATEPWNVMFAFGSGWPSEKWFERSLRPNVGDAPGDLQSHFILGLNAGIGSECRRWNGEVPIEVSWRGVSLPGPLCIAVAAAPLVQHMLRGWLIPRARRRRKPAYERWNGRCASCGYDLRASRDCCPECGQPIPMNIIMMRARRRVLSARSRALLEGHAPATRTTPAIVTETTPSTDTPPPPG
jgi:hypothetical protein